MYTHKTLREIAQTIRLYKGNEDYIAAKLDSSADAWKEQDLRQRSAIEAGVVLLRGAKARETELVEALKSCLWRLEQYGYSAMQPTIDRARAAIKKATGG